LELVELVSADSEGNLKLWGTEPWISNGNGGDRQRDCDQSRRGQLTQVG
jgi:hypothetical protein